MAFVLPFEYMRAKRTKLSLIAFVLAALAAGLVAYAYFAGSPFAPRSVDDTGQVQGVAASSSEALVSSVLPGEEYDASHPNIRRELRPEQVVRTWTHANGTVVTLYQKDLFVGINAYAGEAATQMIVKASVPGRTERMLLNDEPWNPALPHDYAGKVTFSPQGRYVTLSGTGYESPFSATYDLVTGAREFSESGSYSYAIPYWNDDESRLALIRPDLSIDGTVAAVFYSATGKPEDLALVKEFRAEAPAVTDPYLADTSRSGDILTLTFWTDRKMWGVASHDDVDEIYTLDLDSGSLSPGGVLRR